MSWTHNFMGFYKLVLLIGLPVVHLYQLLCCNIFLNTSAVDAKGLEWLGNTILTPYQYFFVGQVAVPTNHQELPYQLTHKFDYDQNWKSNTISSLLLLPQSVALGVIIKGISYLSQETSARHLAIAKSIYSPLIKSNNENYRKIGIPINDFIGVGEKARTQNFTRREGDENNLAQDKHVLKKIIEIFEKEQIPYWIDCGSCLGTYRYQGVIPWDNDIDLAILQPDFDNAKRALHQLDPNEFAIFDWSSRDKPKSYLKVHMKGTDVLVDIYHYEIDPEKRTLTYMLSNENNIFMSEVWLKRELKYKTPIPFDMIFPLKRALFDGIEVSVPNQLEEYLKVRYGENLDPIMIYDKASDSYQRDLKHPYWKFIEG